MERIKGILRNIGILAGLNLLYLVFLSCCFLLPVESIIKNVESSLEIWVEVKDPTEMDYPIFDQNTLYWDSFSDMIWANMVTVEGSNPVKQAIKLDRYRMGESPWDSLVGAIYYRDSAPLAPYSRYWNVNIGFLKILFSIMTLSEIRFLLYWIILVLLLFLLYRISKVGGVKGAIPIVAAFMMTSLELHAMSLSFFEDIVLTLIFMIWLTYYLSGTKEKRKLGLYSIFMILGSLTFAAGPLVAPVMTVGMCLVLYLQLEKESRDNKSLWINVIFSTIWWIIGYIATLFIKQILAKIVLGSSDGVGEALMWFGEEMGIKERFSVLGVKIVRCFTPSIIKLPAFLLLIGILLILCYKWKCKSHKTLQFGFVALYPVFWVLIVSRHSIHSFTSNLFAVTIYAIISILINHTAYGDRRKDTLLHENGK